MKAAVIGCPVGHSLSPLIHNYWIGKYGLEGKYDAREIQPGQLAEGVARLIEEGYTGFSVTIPHKQAVMALCDTADETARSIGAVNCVAVDADGAVAGLNTDWFGFAESVREAAPDFDFARKPALVLGAGGAARAVVYGLRSRGAKKIIIANRTADRAAALAGDFGAEAVSWDDREQAAAGAGLVVNTTAAGMAGKPKLEFSAGALPKDALVCDIVYNPLETALLRGARERGNVTVGGLGMLLHQARPAFERWTGILPAVTDELRETLLGEAGGMIVIGITGSMGMGKTTAANMLRDMGIPVHDSDDAVRTLTGPDGAAVREVALAFPESHDRAGNAINRGKLRELVHNNHEKLDLLELILHPLVVDMQQEWLRLQQSSGVKIAGLDIPLLFETGAENRVDYTITVTCPDFVQRERVLAREGQKKGGMSEEDFEFLLSRQMPDAEKRQHADFVVQTGNGLAYTRRELEGIIAEIRGNAPRHESNCFPS